MTEPTPPQRIFMASDLSARSDRALARAALLARAWQRQLTVAHVVHAAEVAAPDRLTSGAPSWRRPESWAKTLELALSADLAAEGIAASSRVVVGSTTEAALQAATDDRAGLVVLGIAKDARMDRIQLGSTVDILVRRSRVRWPMPVSGACSILSTRLPTMRRRAWLETSMNREPHHDDDPSGPHPRRHRLFGARPARH